MPHRQTQKSATRRAGSGALAQLLLLLSAVFWGASFIFTKGLLNAEPSITPSLILVGRLFFATLFVVPLLVATHRLERIAPRDLAFFLLLSFVEPFLYSFCETAGLSHVSSSLAAIIIALIPLSVPFSMSLFYGERVKANAVIGLLLSLAGIAISSMEQPLEAEWRGLLFLSGAVVIAVAYNLLLVKVLKRYRPYTITAYQNAISLFYFLVVALIFDRHELTQLSFSPQMLLMLIFLGVFCSSLAYMFYNYGMRAVGPTIACAYNNLIPVFTLLLAVAVGQESMTWIKVVGMVVVVVGLFVAQHDPMHNKKQSNPV